MGGKNAHLRHDNNDPLYTLSLTLNMTDDRQHPILKSLSSQYPSRCLNFRSQYLSSQCLGSLYLSRRCLKRRCLSRRCLSQRPHFNSQCLSSLNQYIFNTHNSHGLLYHHQL